MLFARRLSITTPLSEEQELNGEEVVLELAGLVLGG